MPYMEKEIIKYTQDVWGSLMDLSAHPIKESVQAGSDFQQAIVQITGAWTGVVLLQCTPDLAHRITEKMYSMNPGAATYQDKKDALGELANMIGGNIKSILPQPSYLSSPYVNLDKNASTFQKTTETGSVAFQCEGKRFLVSVLKDAEYPPLMKEHAI